MIVDLLVTALLAALDAVLSLLPSWSPPEDMGSTTALGYVHQVTAVFPVQSVVLALVAVLVLNLALSLWDLGVWVYHQFWGSS